MSYRLSIVVYNEREQRGFINFFFGNTEVEINFFTSYEEERKRYYMRIQTRVKTIYIHRGGMLIQL